MIFIVVYEKIGYLCYKVSATESIDIELLRNLTKDKTTLIAGHSGVGKSTIVNAMDSNLDLKVGEISMHIIKENIQPHSQKCTPLTYGGFIIDTPGIKVIRFG